MNAYVESVLCGVMGLATLGCLLVIGDVLVALP